MKEKKSIEISDEEYDQIITSMAQDFSDAIIDELNTRIDNKEWTTLFGAFVLMELGLHLYQTGFKKAKEFNEKEPFTFTQILDEAILTLEKLRET